MASSSYQPGPPFPTAPVKPTSNLRQPQYKMDDQPSSDLDSSNINHNVKSSAQQSGTQNGQHNSSEPACDQCRTRKIRCNREQPKCSNCRKARVACGFSNKGKRVNHMTKLVKNVDVLGKRMDKFEAAIVKCVNAVEQHISITNTSLQCTKARSPDEESDVLETMEPWSAHVNGDEGPIANSEEWVLSLKQKNRHLVKESGGDERFFGSGSMYSIWVETIATTKGLFARSSPETQNLQNPRRSLENAVVAALDPNLTSALERACEYLQSYSAELALEGCSDRTPLSLPPRFLLETILDPFLKELNPILPIFARSSLLEAIKVQYDPQQQQQLDPAWATCFNNLILRILSTKASRGVESSARSTMDDRLRTHLLLNAQRCYSDLGGLLKPRIVNVQALLSMALVALKYFRYPIFETLFAIACQLAKAMGLHQHMDSASSQDIEAERINLFWTLFIMDKQLALMCGKSCHLHAFDCDVPLPASETTRDMPLRDHWVAAIKLAFINEDIYRNVYSAESARASDAQRQRKVEMLTQKLRNWTTAHQQLMNDDETGSAEKSPFSLELRYSVLTSEILVLRRSKNRESKAQILTNARAGLNIIKGLYQASITIGSNIALERVLLHYPLVTFVDLYKSTIEDASTASPEDIPLLLFVAERISNQEDTLSQLPYIGKLKTVTALCSAVCVSIKEAKEPSAAAGPNLSSFSLPDQSPPGLRHFHRSSDSFNSLPDTDYQALSESGHTLPEIGSTLGGVDFSTGFQLQYMANTPPAINQSSSDTYEGAGRTGPFYPFQQGNPAPQTTHNLPQASLSQNWPPTISSDQMDFTSYLNNFEAI